MNVPIFLMSYFLLGAVTSAVTIKVFPPIDGFHPKKTIVAMAVTVFTLLWPVLVLLAAWYHLTGAIQRRRAIKPAPEMSSESRLETPLHTHLGRSSFGHMSVSKPR